MHRTGQVTNYATNIVNQEEKKTAVEPKLEQNINENNIIL
jgi:hypothetical protein